MRQKALLALALALLSSGEPGRAADPRAELEALRKRRASEEAAARVLAKREGSLLGALDDAEQDARAAEGAALAAERSREEAKEGLALAQRGERSAEETMEALRDELVPRLRARARLDALSELRLLAGSDSLSDLVKRRWLWRRVTAHDLVLLGKARVALAEGEAARSAREREAMRAARMAEEAARQRREASLRRDTHLALLASVREEREAHRRAAAEVAAQEKKLTALLAALAQREAPPARPQGGAGPLAASDFTSLRGKLPHPAEGALGSGFGKVVDPRFNTVTVQHGLDIEAPKGAPVRAVAPGRVAHAGWFRGYGNLIIVDHGGGYHTLVAHLASMSTATGEEVERGTLLGTVGDTGSLKGPYLYFEIRERGRPVNPRPWLGP